MQFTSTVQLRKARFVCKGMTIGREVIIDHAHVEGDPHRENLIAYLQPAARELLLAQVIRDITVTMQETASEAH